MTRDDGGDSGSIETDQGCCGGGADGESADACCGSDASADAPTPDTKPGIETDQGCCGGGAAADEGCGDSSCCRGDAAGDPGPGAKEPRTADAPDGSPKTPAEREQLRIAALRTDAMLAEMVDAWSPDWTEATVAEFLHDELSEAGLEPAWEWEHCPVVHAGAEADVGHGRPGERTVPAGELLHVDFGVSYEGYAADLQRLYYHQPDPGAGVPDDLQAAFGDVRAAIDAGLAALEPGVPGHEVDAAARAELTDRGWSAFQHAFGHQVGRDAHDGGTLLGPQRDRYGDRPAGEVRSGETYSVELGVGTTYGYVGQEEMVAVVEDGYEFLSAPQTALRILEGW